MSQYRSLKEANLSGDNAIIWMENHPDPEIIAKITSGELNSKEVVSGSLIFEFLWNNIEKITSKEENGNFKVIKNTSNHYIEIEIGMDNSSVATIRFNILYFAYFAFAAASFGVRKSYLTLAWLRSINKSYIVSESDIYYNWPDLKQTIMKANNYYFLRAAAVVINNNLKIDVENIFPSINTDAEDIKKNIREKFRIIKWMIGEPNLKIPKEDKLVNSSEVLSFELFDDVLHMLVLMAESVNIQHFEGFYKESNYESVKRVLYGYKTLIELMNEKELCLYNYISIRVFNKSGGTTNSYGEYAIKYIEKLFKLGNIDLNKVGGDITGTKVYKFKAGNDRGMIDINLAAVENLCNRDKINFTKKDAFE